MLIRLTRITFKIAASQLYFTFALKVTNLKQQAARTNDKETWNKLGDGYFEMGIFNEAAQMYKRALSPIIMQHMVRLKRALALQKNLQIYTAIEEVPSVLTKEPKHLYAIITWENF